MKQMCARFPVCILFAQPIRLDKMKATTFQLFAIIPVLINANFLQVENYIDIIEVYSKFRHIGIWTHFTCFNYRKYFCWPKVFAENSSRIPIL